MKYVLDSSVAFKWVVNESLSITAQKIRADFISTLHELVSPDIFPSELAHALTRAERQLRISVGDAIQLWSDVMTTSPRLLPATALLPRAIDLSSRNRIGVYDCLYVALAEREGIQLITADDKLVKRFQP